MTQHLLEIVVYTTQEAPARFVQDDPALARAAIETLSPPVHFFNSQFLIFGGGGSTSFYKSSQVVRVDLIGEGLPNWPFLQGATLVEEIDAREFHQEFKTEEFAAKRRAAWAAPGTAQIGFTETEMATGETVVWRVTMESLPLVSMDIIPYTTSLFKSGGLHARLHSGNGYVILNPANITRLSFYPGPPVLPMHGLSLHREL